MQTNEKQTVLFFNIEIPFHKYYVSISTMYFQFVSVKDFFFHSHLLIIQNRLLSESLVSRVASSSVYSKEEDKI